MSPEPALLDLHEGGGTSPHPFPFSSKTVPVRGQRGWGCGISQAGLSIRQGDTGLGFLGSDPNRARSGL